MGTNTPDSDTLAASQEPESSATGGPPSANVESPWEALSALLEEVSPRRDARRLIARPRVIAWGLVLAAAAAVLCGLLAMRWHPPLYESEVLIRIDARLYDAEGLPTRDQATPHSESYMQDQLLLLGSKRAAELADRDPVWRALGLKAPAKLAKRPAGYVRAEWQPGSDLLRVSVRDRDPKVAAAAAQAACNAYAELFEQGDASLNRQVVGVLEERQRALAARLQDTRQQILALAKKHGTPDAGRIFDAAATRLGEVESAILAIHLARAGGGHGSTTPRDPRPEPFSRHGRIAWEETPPTTRPAAEPPDLRQREAALLALKESVCKELADVARDGAELAALTAQAEKLRRESDVCERRINALQTERMFGGPLMVLGSAEAASAPGREWQERKAILAWSGGAFMLVFAAAVAVALASPWKWAFVACSVSAAMLVTLAAV